MKKRYFITEKDSIVGEVDSNDEVILYVPSYEYDIHVKLTEGLLKELIKQKLVKVYDNEDIIKECERVTLSNPLSCEDIHKDALYRGIPLDKMAYVTYMKMMSEEDEEYVEKALKDKTNLEAIADEFVSKLLNAIATYIDSKYIQSDIKDNGYLLKSDGVYLVKKSFYPNMTLFRNIEDVQIALYIISM